MSWRKKLEFKEQKVQCYQMLLKEVIEVEYLASFSKELNVSKMIKKRKTVIGLRKHSNHNQTTFSRRHRQLTTVIKYHWIGSSIQWMTEFTTLNLQFLSTQYPVVISTPSDLYHGLSTEGWNREIRSHLCYPVIIIFKHPAPFHPTLILSILR